MESVSKCPKTSVRIVSAPSPINDNDDGDLN